MLYGDGIHNDGPGIQALLDSGMPLVYLPVPEKFYLIANTLKIHSNQELRLDRYSEVRLADGANCFMLTNADFENGNENIRVTGGIWNGNNMGQARNPISVLPFSSELIAFTVPQFIGFAIYFVRVKNLYVGDLTVKDPVNFAITAAGAEHATFENIYFDFKLEGHPPENMDGVHLCGGCRFVLIRNIHGACYDDMIALNADEGPCAGPIDDVQVDGLYAEGCHSAVRLLANAYPVRRVSISNVYGTYFQYCIGITRYYSAAQNGYYDGLVIKNIFAAKEFRHSKYKRDGQMEFPFLWIEKDVVVRDLHISDVYRREENVPLPTLAIEKRVRVDSLLFENVFFENLLSTPAPVIENRGSVGRFIIRNVRFSGGELFVNGGTVDELVLEP